MRTNKSGLMTFLVELLLVLPGPSIAAKAPILTFRCVNTASHASWNLKVDTAQRTVDGFSASITSGSITWRDTAHGGSYALDRASGQLIFTNSSSMGGYMLFYRCQLK